ncbi:MAG: hypothetical protein GY820_35690 [Gammaproteobacteria bacterium]|nr:hypothetical protein [Gammaproteobacteria bacterium]
MDESSYTLMLRNLTNDYFHNHIGFDEYRSQRKLILDKVDKEVNGTSAAEDDQEDTSDINPLLMQTIGLFKNKDIEN